MVSYDGPKSFAFKGKYIAEAALAGLAIWEAGGDYHDTLLDAVRRRSGMDK